MNFFATKSDILSRLTTLEISRRLRYTLMDIYDSEDSVTPCESVTALESLGICPTGDVTGESYLILDESEELNIRPVPQLAGGIKYFVDQLWNPQSVTLSPGGLYEDKCIVAGVLGTAHGYDSKSADLFKAVKRCLTKGFHKIDGYYVGPDAFEMSKRSDLRMVTMSIKEAKEYDLRIDHIT